MSEWTKLLKLLLFFIGGALAVLLLIGFLFNLLFSMGYIPKTLSFHYQPEPYTQTVNIHEKVDGTPCCVSLILILMAVGWAFTRYKAQLGKQMEIKLEKSDFLPGDVIAGTIKLHLKKPTMARCIRIEFYGFQRDKAGDLGTTNFIKQIIGSRRIYNDGEEFKFSLVIPVNCLPKSSSSQVKDKGLYGFFLNDIIAKTEWQLSAILDIPMGIDISNKVQLNLHRPKEASQTP
jgi:hypothetical protein